MKDSNESTTREHVAQGKSKNITKHGNTFPRNLPIELQWFGLVATVLGFLIGAIALVMNLAQ